MLASAGVARDVLAQGLPRSRGSGGGAAMSETVVVAAGGDDLQMGSVYSRTGGGEECGSYGSRGLDRGQEERLYTVVVVGTTLVRQEAVSRWRDARVEVQAKWWQSVRRNKRF